jgi:hypothetical protein
VKDLPFCTILNGKNVSSSGLAWAAATDTMEQASFLWGTSVTYVLGQFQLKLQNTASCRAAYASFACLFDIRSYYCKSSKLFESMPCRSLCENFLTDCSNLPYAQTQAVCDLMSSSSVDCAGADQQTPTPVISVPATGSSCSAVTVTGMATCSALNGVKLTPAGLGVAAGMENAGPEGYSNLISSDSDMTDSPKCKASWFAFKCLTSVSDFHCTTTGAQTRIPPCTALCTSFYLACYPSVPAVQVAAVCKAVATSQSLGTSSNTCLGADGAIVPTSTVSSAPASLPRRGLVAFALIMAVILGARMPR